MRTKTKLRVVGYQPFHHLWDRESIDPQRGQLQSTKFFVPNIFSSYLIQQVEVPLHNTLQEHQTNPTNATVCKVFDIEKEWWSIRKLVF